MVQSDAGFAEQVNALTQIFVRRLTMLYLPQEEKGQGLVEYALILVLVAIVVIAILTLLGPAIGAVFSNIIWSL
jgi:pilus assembly protein Flp/PilA